MTHPLGCGCGSSSCVGLTSLIIQEAAAPSRDIGVGGASSAVDSRTKIQFIFSQSATPQFLAVVCVLKLLSTEAPLILPACMCPHGKAAHPLVRPCQQHAIASSIRNILVHALPSIPCSSCCCRAASFIILRAALN